MKINFDASFQQVQRLMQHVPQSAETLDGGVRARFNAALKPFEHDRTLINSQPKQDVTEAPVNPLPAPPVIPKGQPLPHELDFRVRTPAPRMLESLPFELPKPDAVNDEIPVPDVKTPTVIRATRVKPRQSAELHSLPQKERIAEVRTMVEEAGKRFGIDPTLGMSVVHAESSFDPKAVSRDGHNSKGLFQLLDRTGKEWHGRLGKDEPYDPFHPEQNVELGVGYLRYLHDIFKKDTQITDGLSTRGAKSISDLERFAVAAFNAGQGRVASAQRRAERAGLDPSLFETVEPFLPESTQSYVTKVLERRTEMSGQDDSY